MPAAPDSPPNTAANGNGAPVELSHPSVAAERVAEPPQRPSVLTTWLLLGLMLALAAVPLVINIGAPEVFDRHEAAAVVTTVHSYHRHVVASAADRPGIEQIVPYYNHELALRRAPGTYWLHRIVMSTQTDPTADVVQLVRLLRLVSAGMALLTVAAVFWCGFSVGGQRTAALAALALASSPIFIFHGRLASPAISHAGWSLLSVAAALWAIRPLKPAASAERQLLGWVICGLALGAATLTAGPVTGVTVVVPILLIMLLSQNRVGHLMGLLAALFMGLLLLLPWVLYAHEQDADIWRHWVVDFSSPSSDMLEPVSLEIGKRALMLALAVVPWTLWFIAGMAQPFSTSSKGQRVRLLLGCVWFLAVALVLLTMPEGNRFGHILPVLPPAAVLLAQLFSYYATRAETGRFARLWRWVRWPHVLFVLCASVAGPVVLFTGDWLPIPDRWRQLPWDLNEWALPAVVSAAMLALAIIGARWAWKNYPARAMVSWAIWSIVLMAVAAAPLSHDERATSPVRQVAQQLGRLTSDTDVYWYGYEEPDPAVLLYAGRALPWLTTAAQVRKIIEQNQPFYLICPAQSPALDDKLTPVEPMHQIGAALWRFEASDE